MKLSTMFFELVMMMLFSVALLAEINVTITEPADGTVVTPCEDLLVKFDYTATAGEQVKYIYLYNHGQRKTRLRKEPWEYVWKKIPKGNYELSATLVTTDEVEVLSDTVRFKAGHVSSGELLYNGGFDCGSLTSWRPSISEEAQGTFTVYDDGYFDDPHYLAVEIDRIGTNRWSLQLFQVCPLDSGSTYEVSLLADALEKKTIYLGFQEGQDPWTSQFGTDIEIDGADMYGPYEFVASKTDPTNDLVFHFGSDETPVFLDNVQVIDRSATSVKSKKFDFDQNLIKEFELFGAYPNPFNMKTTIRFELSMATEITLDIYNMNGRKIKTLSNGFRAKGMHSITWDGMDQHNRVVPSGVYIYQLSVHDGSFPQRLSRKVLLLK